jgi:hypothetical protein
LLALGFVLAGCEIGNGETVDMNLHGRWESTTTPNSGLTINFYTNTITIFGYDQTQYPWDVQRPFRDLARNSPYTCSTEDKKLVIERINGQSVFPYTYNDRYSEGIFLMFSFGDTSIGFKDEVLRRTGTGY